MADEKVNASPEEKKAPEAPAPSGPGDPPAPKHTEGPAVPGGDQTAPAHVEPAMPEKTEGPIKPEQSVIKGGLHHRKLHHDCGSFVANEKTVMMKEGMP